MTTDAAVAATAELIWSNWQAGTVVPDIPMGIRPGTRAEAYAAQRLMAAKSPGGTIGWKIAATSKAGQQHIGVDGPIGGRLLRAASHPSDATISLAGNRMRFAEPEFAFRVGRAIAPRTLPYTVAEAVAAMDGLLPAIEIPDSRLEHFVTAGAAQLIADNACGREFVAGEPTRADWRSLDLAAHAVRATVGGRYTRDGVGANVLDGPLLALTWLVNELSGLGIPLAAGEVITTGTCMPPLPVEPGDDVSIDFGVLGKVTARFKA